MILRFIAAALLGYLLGSVPFGLVFSKLKGRGDIRNYGSGRTGGTNVLRTMGRGAFVLVAALDVLKAVAAVLLAGLIFGKGSISFGHINLTAPTAQALAGFMAVIGHIWPVFAGFRGGRGVSTFVGGMFALCPVAALFAGEVLIIAAGLTGYASLGSLIGAAALYTIMIPMVFFYGYPMEYLLYAMAGSILIKILHRDNIKRLLAGKERKLNQKAEVKPVKPEPEPPKAEAACGPTAAGALGERQIG